MTVYLVTRLICSKYKSRIVYCREFQVALSKLIVLDNYKVSKKFKQSVLRYSQHITGSVWKFVKYMYLLRESIDARQINFIKSVNLSWVHMHNLHPGANLHPGCKFAPRVFFWPCERCFKNLHICYYFRNGANLFAPGCKFASGCNLCI